MDKQKDPYNLEFYKSLEGAKALEERLKGRLPIIEISGHPFFVDVNMGCLRPIDNFSSMGLDMINGGEWNATLGERTFYYDSRTMTEAEPPVPGMQIPAHIQIVAVPDLYTLDPVAMARRHGLDLDTILKNNPLIMFSKAKVSRIHDDEQLKQVRTRFFKTLSHNSSSKNAKKKGRKP